MNVEKREECLRNVSSHLYLSKKKEKKEDNHLPEW